MTATKPLQIILSDQGRLMTCRDFKLISRLILIDRQSVMVERDSTPGVMYKLGDGAEMCRRDTLKYLHLLRCQVIDELEGKK